MMAARKLMVAGGPVVITRTASPSGVAASGSTITYSSQSIGAASFDRIICLLWGQRDTATISGVTIDYGTGAVSMSVGTAQAEGTNKATIYYASAPSGTTATFVISGATGVLATENKVSIYSVTGAKATPAANGGDGSIDFDATDPLTTGSITIPTGGGFLAVVSVESATTTTTWSNATEDLDLNAGVFAYTTATRTTAGTVTITATASADGERGALSYIIFNPQS